MKVLFIIPPYVPSYLNAGHHLPVFMTGAYVRQNQLARSVTCIDAGALNFTWHTVCRLLVRGKYDVIFILNDFDAIDGLTRFTQYCQQLSPQTRLVTFGRLSKQVPEFFQNLQLDAIHYSGDYETGAADYLAHCRDQTALPKGFLMRSGDSFVKTGKGDYLPANQWVLPDVSEIPYEAYESLYKDDLNKFCGIPDRRELVVQAARGCPVNCSFCDVPRMQGQAERRLPVASVLKYIRESYAEVAFEYVSFYAPTFTLDRKWVMNLCSELIGTGSSYKWKCVTTLWHLDEQLISMMGVAGCIRISVGLETLDEHAYINLPKIKRNNENKLEEIASLCNAHGIELNCFIILGLPGDSLAGLNYTIRKTLSLGARVRPVIYTPYEQMHGSMTASQIARYNRQLFVDPPDDPNEIAAYYDLLYANTSDTPTQVMNNIPVSKV